MHRCWVILSISMRIRQVFLAFYTSVFFSSIPVPQCIYSISTNTLRLSLKGVQNLHFEESETIPISVPFFFWRCNYKCWLLWNAIFEQRLCYVCDSHCRLLVRKTSLLFRPKHLVVSLVNSHYSSCLLLFLISLSFATVSGWWEHERVFPIVFCIVHSRYN